MPLVCRPESFHHGGNLTPSPAPAPASPAAPALLLPRQRPPAARRGDRSRPATGLDQRPTLLRHGRARTRAGPGHARRRRPNCDLVRFGAVYGRRWPSCDLVRRGAVYGPRGGLRIVSLRSPLLQHVRNTPPSMATTDDSNSTPILRRLRLVRAFLPRPFIGTPERTPHASPPNPIPK